MIFHNISFFLGDLYILNQNTQIYVQRQAVFIVVQGIRLMEIWENFPGLVHIYPEDPEGT